MDRQIVWCGKNITLLNEVCENIWRGRLPYGSEKFFQIEKGVVTFVWDIKNKCEQCDKKIAGIMFGVFTNGREYCFKCYQTKLESQGEK